MMTAVWICIYKLREPPYLEFRCRGNDMKHDYICTWDVLIVVLQTGYKDLHDWRINTFFLKILRLFIWLYVDFTGTFYQ